MATPGRLALAPLLALAGGVAVTLLVAAKLQASEREAEAARFQWRARAHAAAVQRGVDAAAVLVDSVAGLFRASTEVEPAEFAAFLASTMPDGAGIRAVEWAPSVPVGERATVEALAARNGIPGFRVRRFAEEAGDEPITFLAPVLYLLPVEGNEAALGFDLASERVRRRALERARDTGLAVTTPPVHTVQGRPGMPSVLLIEPVYAAGSDTMDVTGRRAGISGYVVGVIDLVDLVEDALGDVSGGEVALWLTGADGLETKWGARTGAGRVIRLPPESFPGEDGGPLEMRLEFPGRELPLWCYPVGEPATAAMGVAVGLFTLAGIGVSIALAGWLYGVGRREAETRQANVILEERVAARTAQLEAAAGDLRRESGERARAEIAERSGRVRLEALLQPLPGALWMADAALCVTSRAGARLAELGLDRLDHASLEEVWGGSELYAPLLGAHRAALEGRSALIEISRDGTVYEVRVLPVPDADIGGIVAVALDVTERRRAEAQRMEAHLLRSQKLESLGLLAGGIAHDFNNLLVGVLGNASLLTMRLPAGSREHAAALRIEGAAQQAARLTRQMLAYSGRGQFVVEPTDLGAVARELGDLLQASISKKITLGWELAPRLPLVMGDAAQVRQLLLNLLTNAADAIGDAPGSVTVKTAVARLDARRLGATELGAELPAGTYVGVEVVDTGCGMDAETVRRMFDPFFTTKPRGHGLGLAASLGILRGHHATVEVESEPGRGTRIQVWFPVSEAAQRPSRAPDPATAPKLPSQRLKVLVVDDEEGVRDVVRETLSSRGDEVVTASDGPDGLRRFAAAPLSFDLVVLDLTLPGMSGQQVLAELARVRGDVPVLLSSGYSEREAMAGAPPGCPVSFLAKPYTLAALRAAVDAAVGRPG